MLRADQVGWRDQHNGGSTATANEAQGAQDGPSHGNAAVSDAGSAAGGAMPGASSSAQDRMPHPMIPIPGQVDEAKLRLDDDSASLSGPEGQETPVKIGAGAAVAVANGISHERRVVVGRMSEFGDNASLVEADEDISHEQLQMIKARTMFQMTEEIADDSGGGRKRLLFLTNSQAEFLASSNASLQKMLDALEVPKPKLIINLLSSQGFTDYVTNAVNDNIEEYGTEEAGLVPGRGPFVTLDDEISAIEKLDHFMASVILPLAAQTQAIIISNACPSDCVLSSSLTRMLSVHRSKWGKDIPFTVLSVSGSVPYLYQNPNETAVWRSIRRASRAWRQRDRKLLELVWEKFENEVPECRCDLDPNAMIYLLVDTIHAKKDTLGHRGPFNKLMNELIRHMASTLPSLTIKTGHSDKPPLEKATGSASSLAVAMEAMLSGSPLLFLDMRERPLVDAPDRETLIANAKREYESGCSVLLENGTPETFDAMSISYFHDVLFGDGNAYTTETMTPGASDLRSMGTKCPLFEAIERAAEGRGATFNGTLAPATVHQINETSQWLANKFFLDAWQIQPESVKKKAADEGHQSYATHYKANISALSVHIRTIISDRNFHHLNLHDVEGAGKLVGELVKLDRLPNETSLQGLLLIKDAWCEYDVTMLMASKYKFRSKLIFIIQLFLAWSMIAVATARSNCRNLQLTDDDRKIMSHVLFGFATLITLTSSLDSILNAKTRWRQLRSCACSLESIIWFYRARIGRFQQSLSENARPEIELCDAINTWRLDLVSSADLQTSDLEKLHAPEVYKHNQLVNKEVREVRAEVASTKLSINQIEGQGGKLKAEGADNPALQQLKSKLKSDEARLSAATISLVVDGDDHYTPVKPEAYIKTRLQKAMTFYQERLPVYNRMRFLLRIAVIIVTATSTVLSYLEMSQYVIVIIALGVTIISWTEFSETAKKIERYARAIRSMKMLLSWWDVLTDVEKAGTDAISKLIETGESIIADERQAWQATANRLANGPNRVNEGEVADKWKERSEDVQASVQRLE